jgi:glutamine synthetase
VLAAGLDGIQNKLDPGEPNTGNLYTTSSEDLRKQGVEMLPANLLDATRELERSDVLRRGLGKVRDGDYVDYFIKVKRQEWQQAHEQITQWELDRYLQLY